MNAKTQRVIEVRQSHNKDLTPVVLSVAAVVKRQIVTRILTSVQK